MEKIFNKLRNLDAYPKINEDFYTRTLSGGVITLLSSLAILLLFFSEFRLYLHTVTETKLLVDISRGQNLQINFDVTFPAIRCSLLSIDVMDISGEQHLNIKHDIVKKRIDANGDEIESRSDGIGAQKIENPLQKHGGRLAKNEKYCGSCFGAEQYDDDCCNSCEEIRDAYSRRGWALIDMDSIDQCKRESIIQRIKDEDGEGCNMHGYLVVSRVAGNFHFAPGKSFHRNIFFDDFLVLQKDSYNISHRINKLSFGESFPGVVNPLDGTHWIHNTSNAFHGWRVGEIRKRYDALLLWVLISSTVVPTKYSDIRGHTVNSNQYSVTEHFKDLDFIHPNSHPGVYFVYDISPIKVTFKEEHISFLQFITNICAVIGGIFTVAGMIYSFVYHGHKKIKKKRETGKLR